MSAPFLWGTASSAYQTEGGWRADGKGLSNWDVHTNQGRVVERLTGRQETGNTAIGSYDRTIWLGDIALMRRLGLTAHRFSLSWPRIMPGGGEVVNAAAIAHYRRLAEDLREAGIRPVATLYHWDHPAELDGGWHNPVFIDRFCAYAEAVFDGLGDLVEDFLTLNEPFIELFLIEPMLRNLLAGVPPRPTGAQYARQGVAAHHAMLAHARVTRAFRARGRRGRIGIALSLSPTTPAGPGDAAAADRLDGLRNRWFLDALFHGDYPDDVQALYRHHDSPLRVTAADRAVLREGRPDVLGVNFYAQAHVRADAEGAFGIATINPDPVPACNGPVRPEALTALLLRLRTEYGDPDMMITENGAGFIGHDDTPAAGVVEDSLRCDYITRHVAAVLDARRRGVRVLGYFLWSLCDNFEWLWGTTARFGLVHVDMDTLVRTPKRSFSTYAALIARGANVTEGLPVHAGQARP